MSLCNFSAKVHFFTRPCKKTIRKIYSKSLVNPFSLWSNALLRQDY